MAIPLLCAAQTTALPYFHRPLAKLVTAMNQNTVKVETSSAVTFLERETLAKLHHAFYQFDAAMYERYTHRAEACLGSITSGGTLANLTALWCARNTALGAWPPAHVTMQRFLVRAADSTGGCAELLPV